MSRVILFNGGAFMFALGSLAFSRGAPAWAIGLVGILAGLFWGLAIGEVIASKRGKS